MASMRERRLKGGGTSYYVTWRTGGTRDGAQQTETISGKRDAINFKRDVELAGHQWPEGWVRGSGYRAPEPEPEAGEPMPTPFGDFALGFVQDRTGIQGDTRQRYTRQVKRLAAELNGIVSQDPAYPTAVAMVETVTDRHIRRWVNFREHRLGNKRKTIANWHGLLYVIFEEAVTQGLVGRNPCKDTHLGRADTGRAVGDEEDGSDMTLLEPAEFATFRTYVKEDSRDFATILVGTGMRWGEATAMKVRDVYLDTPVPRISVRRAWKKIGDEGAPANAVLHNNGKFYIGRPKSKKGIRNITLDSETVKVLRRAIEGKEPNDFVFTAPRGGALDHGHFYERVWTPAVKDAKAAGFEKSPRIHDLRHTHVGWLLSATPAVPLTVVMRRLGHENITTTVNTYGHLVHEAHEVVASAIRNALLGRKLVAVQEPVEEDVVTYDDDDILPDELTA